MSKDRSIQNDDTLTLKDKKPSKKLSEIPDVVKLPNRTPLLDLSTEKLDQSEVQESNQGRKKIVID